MALWAHIRRVVRDSAGVNVDLGRRERLFRGGPRDAAPLQSPTCIWFGCDAPVRRGHVDHNVEWVHRGTPDPANAAPLCAGHNLPEQRGRLTVRRAGDGTWTISDGEGKPVGG